MEQHGRRDRSFILREVAIPVVNEVVYFTSLLALHLLALFARGSSHLIGCPRFPLASPLSFVLA
eukprot:13780057-Ditylum_brightwellii.AAC.1